MELALKNHPIDFEFDHSAIIKKIFKRNNSKLALTFSHSIDVYLKDSNATGNVYFARYFEWQGVCRERWFHQCIQQDMLQNIGVFITKSARQDYMHETFAFQRVDCYVNTYNIRNCSFSLRFKFMMGDEVVGIGHQEIVFAGHDKRIKKLPADIIDKIKSYEISIEH